MEEGAGDRQHTRDADGNATRLREGACRWTNGCVRGEAAASECATFLYFTRAVANSTSSPVLMQLNARSENRGVRAVTPQIMYNYAWLLALSIFTLYGRVGNGACAFGVPLSGVVRAVPYKPGD